MSDFLKAVHEAADKQIKERYDGFKYQEEHLNRLRDQLTHAVQDYVTGGVADATYEVTGALGTLGLSKPRDFFDDIAETLKRPLILGAHNMDWRGRWKVELTAPRGKHTENLMSGLLLLAGSIERGSSRDVIRNDSSRQRWRFYFYQDGMEHYEAFRAIMRKDKVARMILNLPKE